MAHFTTSENIRFDGTFTQSLVLDNFSKGTVAEVTDVTTVADVAGSLNSTYFTFDTPSEAFYVWYDVAGGGVDPAPGGTGIQVAINTDDTAVAVAAASETAINASGANVSAVTGGTSTITITNINKGSVPDATAGTSGFTILVTTQGEDEQFKKLVPWDFIPLAQQTAFEETINEYGGSLTVPSSPAACILDFGGNVVGGNSSGLDGTVTSGSQTADYGGSITGGADPTGLANDNGTAGTQIAQFPVSTTGATSTGLADTSTSGFQVANYGGTVTAGGNSGLNDSVAEVTDVTTVADTLGSLNSTYFTFDTPSQAFYVWYDVAGGGVDPAPGGTGIQVAINTNDTAVAVAAASETAINGSVANVNAVTGGTSTITITNDNTGSVPDATAGTSGFTILVTTQGTDGTNYTATFTIDGVGIPFAEDGINLTLFSDVIDRINATLGANATASIVSGNIRTESSTTGTTSTVSITDTNFFSSSTGFVSFDAAVAGTDGDPFTFDITVDGGVTQNITIFGVNAQTFTDLGNTISSNVTGASATLLSDGEFTFTSDTTGVGSSILVVDTGLFDAMPEFAELDQPVAGTAPTTYEARIRVDGLDNFISIVGNTAQTFGDLINEINADLTGATAALSGGNIVVTSSSTGSTSKIDIRDFGLFTATNGFVKILAAVTGFLPLPVKAIINVDGTDQNINIDQASATTFTDLINEINADLTGATASIVNGDIRIESSTTGIASKISVRDLNLFVNLNFYTKFIKCFPGVDDLDDVLRFATDDNGSTFNEIFALLAQQVGERPIRGPGPEDQDLVYFDGTNYRFIFNDAIVP